MSCSSQQIEESYEFFEDIENYIGKANLAGSIDISTSSHSECDSFMNSSGSFFTDNKTAKIICEQLIKLHDSLADLITKPKSDINYKKCIEFLNYWVNLKLIENMKNKDYTVRHVYDHLEGQITGRANFNIYLICIYDLKKDYLDKMNILYNLHKKYSEINSIIDTKSEHNKQKLLTLSTQCCTDYNDISYICNGDNKVNNHKFCDKLKAFESKYNKLDGKLLQQEPDFSDYFIKLSECPNTKIISTAVTGSIIGLIPLLGVLYKFTPMGQMFRSKIGIINDISNNDEEMTNISLLEQENEQLKFQKGTYNIKYQSL